MAVGPAAIPACPAQGRGPAQPLAQAGQLCLPPGPWGPWARRDRLPHGEGLGQTGCPRGLSADSRQRHPRRQLRGRHPPPSSPRRALEPENRKHQGNKQPDPDPAGSHSQQSPGRPQPQGLHVAITGAPQDLRAPSARQEPRAPNSNFLPEETPGARGPPWGLGGGDPEEAPASHGIGAAGGRSRPPPGPQPPGGALSSHAQDCLAGPGRDAAQATRTGSGYVFFGKSFEHVAVPSTSCPAPHPPPLVLNRFDGQDRPGPRQSVGFTEGTFVSARGAPGPLRPQGPAPHRRLRLQLRVPVFTAPGRGQTPQEGMSAVPSGAAASRPGTQPGAPGTGTPAGACDGPGAGRRASTPGLTGAPRPRALGLLLRRQTFPLTGRGWQHWPLRAQGGDPAGRAGNPSGQRGHKPTTSMHSEGETP